MGYEATIFLHLCIYELAYHLPTYLHAGVHTHAHAGKTDHGVRIKGSRGLPLRYTIRVLEGFL